MNTSSVKRYQIPSGYYFNLTLADQPQSMNNEELADYFNDLYKLFLHNYARIGHEVALSADDEIKMTAMFAELLKVKRMLNQ